MPLTLINLSEPFCGDRTSPDMTVISASWAVASDLATTPAMREHWLTQILPGPAILTDESAVFVHTGRWLINPACLTMPQCAPVPGTSTRWTTDRRTLHPGDVVGRTTTKERTLADLLFLDNPVRTVAPIMALLAAGTDIQTTVARLGSKYRGASTASAKEFLRQLVAAQASTCSSP